MEAVQVMKLTYKGENQSIEGELAINKNTKVVSSFKVNINEKDEEKEDRIMLEYSNNDLKSYHYYRDENTNFEIKFSRVNVHKPEITFYVKEDEYETVEEAIARTIDMLLDSLPGVQDTKEGIVYHLYANMRKLHIVAEHS